MKKILLLVTSLVALAVLSFFISLRYGPRYFLEAPIIYTSPGIGIQLIPLEKSQAFFDIDLDGKREKVSWFGGKIMSYLLNDGVLVIDKNKNNYIDDANEFFGKKLKDEELLEYDVNKDGIINKEDPIFNEIMIWRDLDGNGFSTKNELSIFLKDQIDGIDFRSAININYNLDGSLMRQEGSVDFIPNSNFLMAQSFNKFLNFIYSKLNLKTNYLTSVKFAIDKNQVVPEIYNDVEKLNSLPSATMTNDELMNQEVNKFLEE